MRSTNEEEEEEGRTHTGAGLLTKDVTLSGCILYRNQPGGGDKFD